MDKEYCKEYTQRLEFYRSFGYDIETERKFILDKALPLWGEILEVGTGKGYFTLELARRGYKLISLDISEEAQKLARLNIERAGLAKQVDFKIANAENLSFPDASFDIIFSINTVHHLLNPLRVIDQLIRIAKPGGKVILSDFNKEGFRVIDRIHQSEGRKHQENRISLSQVKRYLLSKNFKVSESESRFQTLLIADRRHPIK